MNIHPKVVPHQLTKKTLHFSLIISFHWHKFILALLRDPDGTRKWTYHTLSCADCSLSMSHPCGIHQKCMTFEELGMYPLAFSKSSRKIGQNNILFLNQKFGS